MKGLRQTGVGYLSKYLAVDATRRTGARTINFDQFARVPDLDRMLVQKRRLSPEFKDSGERRRFWLGH